MNFLAKTVILRKNKEKTVLSLSRFPKKSGSAFFWALFGVLGLSSFSHVSADTGSSDAQVPLASQSSSTTSEGAAEISLNTTLQTLLEGGDHYLGVGRYFTIPNSQVFNLYQKASFQPLWFTDTRKTEAADAVLNTLKQVEEEGLDPKDYAAALEKIGSLLKTPQTDSDYTENLLRADILLSHALLQYISDARGERLTPKKIDKELYLAKPEVNEEDILYELIEKSRPEDKTADWLALIPPQHPEYQALKAELKKLLTQEDQGLAPSKTEEEDAQEAHNNKKRGGKGKKHRPTVRTAQSKINQLIVTMERWRWMPEKLADKYILVNIPEFKAFTHDRGKLVFDMNVIIGKDYRETPVLYSKITNIIFNPIWNVPHQLAVHDELPLIQKRGADYLTKKKIRVYQNGVEIDPHSVDWSAIGPGSFDFSFKQDPGNQNALGRLRFTIHTPFDVFLHGTPEQKLFSRSKRNLSSGCIRLEDPVKMAVFVFGDQAHWSEGQIQKDIDTDTTKTVSLKTPVDVYLEYFTARPNDAGEIQYFDDIYGQDKQILKALKSRHARAP